MSHGSRPRPSAVPTGLLLLLLVLLPGGALLGQETTGEEDDQQEEAVVVETVYVTAQKRSEDLQDVPAAVTAIGSEQLEAISAGGADVRMLSARAPSIVAESSFGRAFPRFYVRGLGNTDFDLNASQPVSFLYDGVVFENPVLKGMPLWDLDRVEVLRGPQGSLFGRNTPAGVVLFESRKPTQESDSYVRGSFGTFETTDVQAAFGGGLTDSLSARLSLLYQGRSDWVDNNFTGESDALGGYDTAAARLQFLFEPSDRFSALLNLHAWDVDGTARLFRANLIVPGTNDIVPGFEPDEIAIDGINQQDIEAQGGALTLEWDLGASTLTSITGYETLEMFSRGDVDGGFGAVFAPPSGPGLIPFPSETADGLPELDQLTQELRLASNDPGPFGWIVGLYYFDEELQADTISYDSLAGNVQNGYSFQRQQAESWALFGSVDYDLSESWELRAGLRYTEDEKDFSAERPQPVFQTPTFAPIVRSTDADFLSWDLSTTWRATEDVNVYGRVATSFRAPSIQGRILFCADFDGGLNPATNCVSVADEEEILSTEVGVKSEFADNRVRLNAAVFRYEVDGQQIVAVGGEFNTATLLNADTTDGYGFELDLTVAPTAEWLFTVGLSHNKTEIDDPTLGVAPCGGGCTVLDPIDASGRALVDGNSLPHAPEWIFNGVVDYRRPVASGLFSASLDWAYHDEKNFFLYESVEFVDDAFELGFRAAYAFADGRYEVGVFGRNLTDEVIVRAGIDFNNLTGMINDPRTFGLQFGFHF